MSPRVQRRGEHYEPSRFFTSDHIRTTKENCVIKSQERGVDKSRGKLVWEPGVWLRVIEAPRCGVFFSYRRFGVLLNLCAELSVLILLCNAGSRAGADSSCIRTHAVAMSEFHALSRRSAPFVCIFHAVWASAPMALDDVTSAGGFFFLISLSLFRVRFR